LRFSWMLKKPAGIRNEKDHSHEGNILYFHYQTLDAILFPAINEFYYLNFYRE
jgi:hypothetical protein